MKAIHSLGLILVGSLFLQGASAAEVKIDSGRLTGSSTTDGQVDIYKGVPFARPPVGELRWEPPQPPKPWRGKRDATEYSLPCYQPTYPDRPNGGGVSGETSEDCLYLNVYAPAAAERAPVMVWFYGGANFLGAGHLDAYDGTSFARNGVVVVTINYRLGPFGFFSHPALTADAEESEWLNNYGNMDQAEALRWVQRNIAAFGGDRDNVTIFGQSAGGAGVYMQLTAPSSRDLFHKAIVHSGSFLRRDAPLALLEYRGADIATQLGLPGGEATLEQLRAVPAETLSEVMPRGTQPGTDGRFMPHSPTEVYAFDNETDVPFIVGSNSGEGMRGAYDRWAATQSADGAPAFLYHFSYVPERIDDGKGARHSAELRYAWNTLDVGRDDATEADRDVARIMHGCWVAFAFYEGDGPIDCGNGLVWPTWHPENRVLMEFSDETGVRQGLLEEQWNEAIRSR